MKINKMIIALHRTKHRVLYTLSKLATSVRRSLQAHGWSILMASSYIVMIALMALMVSDSNFRTDVINRLEVSRQIVDNRIQGAFNAIPNALQALARRLGGY